MRLHFVSVPIHGSDAAEAEVNRFLATHRVLAVDRQLVSDGPRSAWAICITYIASGATTAASAGVGPARLEKYGRAFLEILREAPPPAVTPPATPPAPAPQALALTEA